MNKSCGKCGKYHDKKFQCTPDNRQKESTEATRFRNTRKWRAKSVSIRERDRALCQVCIRMLYGTTLQYNFESLEVHHIVPLHADMRRAMDDFNLISLCQFHHKMAERYDIPQSVLHRIAKEQEGKRL